jgi:hypothetical protein
MADPQFGQYFVGWSALDTTAADVGHAAGDLDASGLFDAFFFGLQNCQQEVGQVCALHVAEGADLGLDPLECISHGNLLGATKSCYHASGVVR